MQSIIQSVRTFRPFLVFVLLLTALSFNHEALCAQSEEDSLYFVQITDTHWGDQDHLERTRKIVTAINDLPFDVRFVVLTGDITMDLIEDSRVASEGLRVLKQLKVPVHFVPGNHDILEEKVKVTRQAYEKDFGPLLSVNQYGGMTFVFLYTEPLAKSFSVEGYEPLKQLRKVLEQHKGKPIVVFHHTPSIENFYNNRMHEGWADHTRKEWIALLNAYHVKAVIAGHFHRDEQHWLETVPLYVCPPVAGYWGRQATFRIYEYRNGRISYRTQYVQ